MLTEFYFFSFFIFSVLFSKPQLNVAQMIIRVQESASKNIAVLNRATTLS
jgi:hypothetical protein